MVKCDACGAEAPEAMVRLSEYASKTINLCNEYYATVAVNPAKYLNSNNLSSEQNFTLKEVILRK